MGIARNREQVQLLSFPLGLKSLLRALGFSALLATVCLPFMDEASAGMFGLFKRYDVHLSPEVRGRVFKDGEPLEGLPVFRELHYDEKKYTDKTWTDPSGRFSFPEKNIKSRAPGQPLNEARNVQVITTDYAGDIFILWHVAVDSTQPSKTLEALLQNLNCDLSSEEITHHFTIHEHPDFDHHIGSICRWSEK